MPKHVHLSKQAACTLNVTIKHMCLTVMVCAKLMSVVSRLQCAFQTVSGCQCIYVCNLHSLPWHGYASSAGGQGVHLHGVVAGGAVAALRERLDVAAQLAQRALQRVALRLGRLRQGVHRRLRSQEKECSAQPLKVKMKRSTQGMKRSTHGMKRAAAQGELGAVMRNHAMLFASIFCTEHSSSSVSQRL